MITMKNFRHMAAVAASTAALLLAAANASAHAKLVSVAPKADSTVASPKLIQAHFNEAVEVKLSTLKLTMPDGMAVSVMGMNDAKDPSTLSIMPNSPLKPGVYTASWSIVTADGHKATGSFKFTVK
ncbi:MAG: copper homeostasis periplasmic binding protein CopC [Steroidobacteraceae bacterium]